jgi:hypothetical protein
VEAIRAPPGELRVAQLRHPTQHGGDPAARPSEHVLDQRERTRLIRRRGKAVEQLAHQVAAAVVERRDLARVVHRVLRRVLGARHRPTVAPG